jgi:cytochrome P450
VVSGARYRDETLAPSFAGHETKARLIGDTVRRLPEDPARWAMVVAHPHLIEAAVTETLRFDPSVTVWRRLTSRPVAIGGVELPARARLFLWLAAAGGMPRRSAARRTSTCTANAGEHLAFGW